MIVSEPSYDRSGAARQALQEIYRDYGLAGIDNDALLNQLLPDLLAGSPREAGLLQAAAATDVGRLLTDRFNGQMPPDAAVRDVAAVLMDRNALDSNACLWIVSEYAAALGHPVAIPFSGLNPATPPASMPPMPGAGLNPAAGGRVVPDGATRMDTGPGSGQSMPPTSVPPAPGYAQQPSFGQTQQPYGQPQAYGQPPYTAPQTPAYGQPMTPTSQFPQVGYQAGQFGQPSYITPKKSKAPLIIGIVAGVVLLACVIGGILVFTSKDKCTGSTCTTTPKNSVSPRISIIPSTPPIVPNDTVPALRTVMPSDVNVTTDCQEGSSLPAGMTNVTVRYTCDEGSSSDLEGAFVDGYQFGTEAAFNQGLLALNTNNGFSPSDAGDVCPPTGSDDSGYTTWHRNNAPSVVLGNLECYANGKGGHVYVWTDKSERTIIVIVSTSSQSYSEVESWWESNNNNH